MNRAWRASLGILAGIVLTGQVASAAVTFSDSNPVTAAAGGNWNSVQSTAGGLYVVSIGNSYSFYDTTVSPFNNNELVLGFTHSEVANVYWGVGARHTQSVTPSNVGPSGITSINYSQNARKGSLDGVAQALLLIQNGKFYRTAFNVIPPSGSSPSLLFEGVGLTAASFGEFNGISYDYGTTGNDPNGDSTASDGRANFLSNPDFSATGAPIQFGWLGHFQSGGGGYGTANATVPATSLADAGDSAASYLLTTDFSITFNDVPIPEPTAAAMLLGLCAIPTLRRRRN